MRYYDLKLTPTPDANQQSGTSASVTSLLGPSGFASGLVTKTAPTTAAASRTWTSHPNGVFNPSAPDIEFDCPIADYATAPNAFTITIHGVSLADLSQATNFEGMQLSLQGGMKSGLPLANPLQAGVLVNGQVFQSYGNWEGTDMRLDLVVLPSSYTLDNPGNIVLNWKAAQPLGPALTNALQVAYPGVPIQMSISDRLVQNHDEVHFSATLQELAMFIQGITRGHFLGTDYGGVRVTLSSGRFLIWDDTFEPPQIQIEFKDLIGQPTWVENNVMVFKTVLRSDLQVGARVLMPRGLQNSPGMVTATQQSFPSTNKDYYQTAFQGLFQISELRHIGSYRSPAGTSWVTVVKCIPNTVPNS
ncbi:hypothetical protein [Burkholderia cepacia]|uniref:hypothetical protein n=1 Tax=Burkholderia cepacia TaxID=292 RepID=UPI000AD34644|nr:hypothetical protein [Burkholderia cepacia]